MDQLLFKTWKYHIALLRTKQPIGGEIKLHRTQLIVGTLAILKFAVNEILTKLVEDSCIKNSYADTVDSQEVSQQNIETVFHYSEPNTAHGIAAVLQVCLKKVNLAEV